VNQTLSGSDLFGAVILRITVRGYFRIFAAAKLLLTGAPKHGFTAPRPAVSAASRDLPTELRKESPMSQPKPSTNLPEFCVGDFVTLAQPIFLKLFPDKTVPAGEYARIVDIDPEAPSDLVLQLVRPFDYLRCWRNHIPAKTDMVTLLLRC
jgi:hypothetical protein